MNLVRFSQDMDGYMEVSKDGDWVNYSSATEAIDELRRTVAEQKEQLAEANALYYSTVHDLAEARKFIDAAFEAHPNLDMDISFMQGDKPC